MGFRVVLSISTKKKLNSRSSTEELLIAVDDERSKLVWEKRLTEAQRFKLSFNVSFQDNAITIKLEENVKSSSGKRTIKNLISQK